MINCCALNKFEISSSKMNTRTLCIDFLDCKYCTGFGAKFKSKPQGVQCCILLQIYLKNLY